jgi:solute carrier family 35, member F1/2
LNQHGVEIPTTQTSFLYLCLFLFYYPLFCFKSKTILPWKQKRIIEFWKYSFLGFVDVEANFLAVIAYRYTSITNASLLLSFTTPSVMILSILMLQRKYKWNHFVGVLICLFGIIGLIFGDYLFTIEASKTAKEILFGNICTIVATIFYATSFEFFRFNTR